MAETILAFKWSTYFSLLKLPKLVFNLKSLTLGFVYHLSCFSWAQFIEKVVSAIISE